jgi:hypothetical protein
MLIEMMIALAFLTSSACDTLLATADACDYKASTDGTDVYLEGTIEAPGGGSGSGSSSGGGDTSTSEPACPDPRSLRDCFTVTGPVTMSDIAAFRPTAASHGMEPNGWAVIGLPTNFFSSGSPVIRSGTLLGGPAEVRFTPVSWSWDYGDGSRRTTATPGRAWRTEFDETATTHVFEERGTYVVTLVVQYRAEWRVAGGSWVPVSGILSLPAPQQRVLVVGARTVLVDEDCNENPEGPGC